MTLGMMAIIMKVENERKRNKSVCMEENKQTNEINTDDRNNPRPATLFEREKTNKNETNSDYTRNNWKNNAGNNN